MREREFSLATPPFFVVRLQKCACSFFCGVIVASPAIGASLVVLG